MGKFLKTCLIVGVICIVVGFVVSSAGIGAGGLTELKDQILKGEWNVDLDLDMDVDPFFELEKQNYFDGNELLSVEVENIEEAFSADGVKGIYIKGAGIAVEMMPYDGSKPELTSGSDIVVCATKSGKFQGFLRDSVLNIIVSGKSEKEVGEGLVQIMIPQAVYDAGQLKVNVEASATTIDFGELQASEVDLEISAGTINWSGLTARELDIDMAAGAVNGTQTVITGSTDIDMKAGAVTLAGVLGADVDIAVSAGKVTLDLAHVWEDYNYDLSCAGGSIKIGDESVEGLAKEREIDNRAAYDMDVECSAGAVEIQFQN